MSGVVASLRGDTAADGLTLFIPGDLAGYVEPEVYVGTAGTWTLREGDIVVVGACTMDVPSYTLAQIEATREAYRITGIETHRLLSAAVHHFEVAAS